MVPSAIRSTIYAPRSIRSTIELSPIHIKSKIACKNWIGRIQKDESTEDVSAAVANAGTSNRRKKAKKDKTRSSTKQKQFVNADEIDPIDDRSMALDIYPAEAFNCHQNVVGEADFFSSNLDRDKLGSILTGINFGEHGNDEDDLFTFSKSESVGDDYA